MTGGPNATASPSVQKSSFVNIIFSRVLMLAALIFVSAFTGPAAHASPARTVVGGAEANITTYPWLAAISKCNPELDESRCTNALRHSRELCAGALIAPDQLLTAAHCTRLGDANPALLTITFGRNDLASNGGFSVRVREVRIDPNYRSAAFRDTKSYHHDTAILVLSAPVLVTPVRIGQLTGDKATVLGWGATSEDDPSNTRLHAATVPLVEDAVCANSYGEEFDAAEAFCAGDTVTDTSDYDSGGPLLVNGLLAGITSWGNGTARPGFPGVYARPTAAHAPQHPTAQGCPLRLQP